MTDYPLTPLASRKAPRLFATDGTPTLTRAEQRFLDDADGMTVAIDNARSELAEALATANPELCATVARRFLAIGAMFAGKAVEAGL